jgi:hypothetical protein
VPGARNGKQAQHGGWQTFGVATTRVPGYCESMSGTGDESAARTLLFGGISAFVHEAARREGRVEEGGPPFYRVALGREPLPLGAVEGRILLLLASKPYRPFARRSIAEAVTTEDFPVIESMVDQYIASLRDQLGFFRDYVQTVPYLGYRFKP